MKKTLLGFCALFLTITYLSAQEIVETPEPVEKRNYTGWVDVSSKELDVKSGIVQIRVKPNLGTFNFAVLNDNDKYVPVLSTANEYTSSGFFLKAGKKRYRLLADINVQPSI